PADARGIHAAGAAFWPLALARELDDLILHLRTNEEQIGLWVFKTRGAAGLVEAYDRALAAHRDDWLVREIRLYLKRTCKRLAAGRHRLAGRGADGARGARVFLARRAHGHGGVAPLRRARDAREQDLRPPLGVAELDLPAPERRRPHGGALGLRLGTARRVR